MKIKKINQVFVGILISFIFMLFFSILLGKAFQGKFTLKFNTLKFTEQTEKSTTLNVNNVGLDWEKIYPYNNNIKAEGLPNYETSNVNSKITKLVYKMKKFGTIGTNWSKMMFKYNEIFKMGYDINSKLTDPSVVKTYIKLKNGYYANTAKSMEDPEINYDVLSDYYYLQQYLESENIDFIYCCTPKKECEIKKQLPYGVISYGNVNNDINMYIEALKSLGINYMDLRENLYEEDVEFYSLFYKTDHHWNMDGGFWATSVIENELNKKYNLNINGVEQFESFARKTYKNAMFGSAGHAVTHFDAESEDFDILFPNFETHFSLEIPDKNIDITGSFEDIVINYDELNDAIENGGGYAYETILYGNRPYVKITNLNNQNSPRILMIRDSFAIAVAPYLALSCSELVLLDTRTGNGNFTGSVVNCINQFEPDVVIALLSAPQPLILNK